MLKAEYLHSLPMNRSSMSEVIGRCGWDEKTNVYAEPTKVEC